jgi:hypothetical protein
MVSVTNSQARILFLDEAATFSSNWLLNCTHEAEWTPFQTHYFSENLVVPGIVTGPLDQKLWPLDHRGGLSSP